MITFLLLFSAGASAIFVSLSRLYVDQSTKSCFSLRASPDLASRFYHQISFHIAFDISNHPYSDYEVLPLKMMSLHLKELQIFAVADQLNKQLSLSLSIFIVAAHTIEYTSARVGIDIIMCLISVMCDLLVTVACYGLFDLTALAQLSLVILLVCCVSRRIRRLRNRPASHLSCFSFGWFRKYAVSYLVDQSEWLTACCSPKTA